MTNPGQYGWEMGQTLVNMVGKLVCPKPHQYLSGTIFFPVGAWRLLTFLASPVEAGQFGKPLASDGMTGPAGAQTCYP